MMDCASEIKIRCSFLHFSQILDQCQARMLLGSKLTNLINLISYNYCLNSSIKNWYIDICLKVIILKPDGRLSS